MDEWLAQIYGTGASDEDIEKVASLSLLEKLAEENDIDLSEFTPEEIEAIAEEVLAGEAEDDEDELAKEAAAKFEEADFLGRVMAHAYTQELEKIAGVKERLESLWKGTKSRAGRAWGHVKSHPKAYGAGAAGLAALGAGGAYALHRRRKGKAKTASDVIEELAEERALEILDEAGLLD